MTHKPSALEHIIDGRPIGDLTIDDADTLSVKKHAEAQKYIRLLVETTGAETQRYKQLAEEAMTDAVLLDKIVEYARGQNPKE